MQLPFQIDLNGKVAVVTGAGGVLCSIFAQALAHCGAKVALLDIHPEAAECVAENLLSEGLIAKAYVCDVLNRKAVERCRDQIINDFGGCHLLINGAGGNHPNATTHQEIYADTDCDPSIKTFFDLDEASVGFVFDLNFMGALIPTQVFAKDMMKEKKSSIINISSMNAFRPLTKIPAYSAAKAAISNFTQWLAVHFANSGLRVNAIAPGFFVTKQNYDLLFDQTGSPTNRAKKIIDSTPMSRFGSPEELIGVLLWLANDQASSFVTGAVIPVDGGFSAFSGV